MKIGIALAIQSLKIIRSQKKLLIFPCLNIMANIGVLLLIFPHLFEIEKQLLETGHLSTTQYVIIFPLVLLFFFLTYLFLMFFSAGMTLYSSQYMQQKDSNGIMVIFKIILKKIHIILLWTLIMTTVGIVIRQFEIWYENFSTTLFANRLLLGLDWLNATLLILPALIIENQMPFQAITRSATLVKNTWGTSVTPNFYVHGIVFFIYLLASLPLTISAFFKSQDALHTGLIITACLMILIIVLKSTIQMLILSAMYLYASNNTSVLAFYEENLLKNALVSQ